MRPTMINDPTTMPAIAPPERPVLSPTIVVVDWLPCPVDVGAAAALVVLVALLRLPMYESSR